MQRRPAMEDGVAFVPHEVAEDTESNNPYAHLDDVPWPPRALWWSETAQTGVGMVAKSYSLIWLPL